MRRQQKTQHPDDEEYFTYRPLSNLPTPPPSSRNSSAKLRQAAALQHGEHLSPKFYGPAVHLVNLIPAAASVATPSVALVQAILSRANLPIETMALAVCVLDALTSKFALSWRLECPLVGSAPLAASKRHTIPLSPVEPGEQQLHIDSVHPELIILAALAIAVKFIDDPDNSTQFYCSVWGRSIWSCEQLNVTERCIMKNLNYRIMPLYDEELLTDAMVDMQLAARQRPYHEDYPSGESDDDDEHGRLHGGRMSTGQAVIGLGLQLTPAETPEREDGPM